MTNKEFIDTLLEDVKSQDIIKEALQRYTSIGSYSSTASSDYVNYLKSIKGVAGIYLRNYVTKHEGDSNVWHTEACSLKECCQNDQVSNPDLRWDIPFFQQLPDNRYIAFTIGVGKSYEVERRSKLKFDTSAKALSLNMFSYKLFEQHILNSKKMTGKDATRYLQILHSSWNLSKDESKIHIKYVKLIWDNVQTKSLQLSKTISNMNFRAHTHKEAPFYTFQYFDIQSPKPVDGWAEEVTFSFNTINSIANKQGIPLGSAGAYLTHSMVHQYITSVDKKNVMSDYDVIHAIDTIRVLSYLNIIDRRDCPYYDMGIAQLVRELKRVDNKQLLSSTESNTVDVANALLKTKEIIVTI